MYGISHDKIESVKFIILSIMSIKILTTNDENIII